MTIWKDRRAEGESFSCIGEGYTSNNPEEYGPECVALQAQTGLWQGQYFDIGFMAVGDNAASTIKCECT